ncbi:hypothetical protein YC2023_063484 [Brassica napus]
MNHIPNYPPKGVQRPNGRDVKSVVAKTRTRVAGNTAVPPLPPSYERLVDILHSFISNIPKAQWKISFQTDPLSSTLSLRRHTGLSHCVLHTFNPVKVTPPWTRGPTKRTAIFP